MYNEDLLNKPSMILINKMDTEGAKDKYDEVKYQINNIKGISFNCSFCFVFKINFADEIQNYDTQLKPKKLLKFFDVMPISAKESENDINMVKLKLRHLLDVVAELQMKELDEENAGMLEDIKKSQREKAPLLV